jgi:hypothetical protein
MCQSHLVSLRGVRYEETLISSKPPKKMLISDKHFKKLLLRACRLQIVSPQIIFGPLSIYIKANVCLYVCMYVGMFKINSLTP